MSQFSDWFQLLNGITGTPTTDNRRQRKRKRLQQALRKITNVMQRRLQAETARKRLEKRQQEDFEDFFSSAFSSQNALGFLTTPGPMTSSTASTAQICDGKYSFYLQRFLANCEPPFLVCLSVWYVSIYMCTYACACAFVCVCLYARVYAYMYVCLDATIWSKK